MAGRGAHAGTAAPAAQGCRELGSRVLEEGCAGSSLPALAGAGESPASTPPIRWELKGCLALRDSAIMLWVVNISLSFLKAKWLLPPEKYINGPSKTLP